MSYVYSIFALFLMLCWYTCLLYTYVVEYQPFQIVSLFLTAKKVSCVFVRSLIFLLFEKMDQRNCIKFCVKNEIKCATTFEILIVTFGESTMRRTQMQLCYNRFNEGREDVNDRATEHFNNR